MELEFFKKLALGEHFHDLERGYEFKKVAQSDTYCTCQCTRKIPFDETTVKVGEILSIDFDAVAIEDLALGKYPDNSKHLYIKTEQPQPEQHSSELKTMLIADALKQGLKVGDKVWAQMEVRNMQTEFESPNSDDFITMGNPAYSGTNLIFKKETTKIIFEPNPYTPKHGEKCRVLTNESIDKYECTAVEIKGKIFAYVEFGEDEGSRIFRPYEIKQFLPL